MNVHLPIDIQPVIRVIIYRDFLCIFLFSEETEYQKTFSYRLNHLFQKEPSFQIPVLEQVLAHIEKIESLKILVNGRLLASKLSSGIKRLELYIPQGASKNESLEEIFDVVIERDSEEHFSDLEKLSILNNSIYIDFDIDRLGVLSNLNHGKMKKVISMDYLFYKANGLESFYENPRADLNVRESKKILTLIPEILTNTLSLSSKDLVRAENIIMGGAFHIFFDTNDIKECLIPILGDAHLNFVIDSNYFARTETNAK